MSLFSVSSFYDWPRKKKIKHVSTERCSCVFLAQWRCRCAPIEPKPSRLIVNPQFSNSIWTSCATHFINETHLFYIPSFYWLIDTFVWSMKTKRCNVISIRMMHCHAMNKLDFSVIFCEKDWKTQFHVKLNKTRAFLFLPAIWQRTKISYFRTEITEYRKNGENWSLSKYLLISVTDGYRKMSERDLPTRSHCHHFEYINMTHKLQTVFFSSLNLTILLILWIIVLNNG